MNRYLLPCGCGGQTVVTAGQAGDRVPCRACGKSLDVPRLGGLAALESAPPADSAARAASGGWTVGHACGLAGLFLAAAATLGAVGLPWWTASEPLVSDAEIRAAVDATDIGSVHRAWQSMARSGVERPPMPEEARIQQLHASATTFSRLLWLVAAAGAALAGAGFAVARGGGQRVVGDG